MFDLDRGRLSRNGTLVFVAVFVVVVVVGVVAVVVVDAACY